MDSHLGCEKSQRSANENARNGYKSKTLNSSYGSVRIEVPKDRQSSFEPQVVKKRQKDISAIDQKIISMYANGMTTRQISETINDIYGFEASEGFVSDVTDKILPHIEEWQNRCLVSVYPIVFIDAIHFSVRQDSIVSKLAAYVVVGINDAGRKEVLTIEIGENESSKYWLGVLNSLKNRGVQDVLILCSDGLSRLKEAVEAAFPETEHQRCIVHMVRNTLKYVAHKDMKFFAKDLRSIYTAPDEKTALKRLEEADKKWSPHYPAVMQRWYDHWDVITPMFIEQFPFEHQPHRGGFSKDIFVPIIFIVSPEFSVMVKCSCPFGDCRISSEKIYVPCPHGSSNDMAKCDVFSIIRAAACSAFLMGGNWGNINDMTILFS